MFIFTIPKNGTKYKTKRKKGGHGELYPSNHSILGQAPVLHYIEDKKAVVDRVPVW